ncbi:uncharacterized protein LOC101851387 [Aplysia californica]|uniref:Uncharacterized protein LOC101851387 n=1 Tax=Aplysia californica TaxID=6500 RepID=A0ABM0JDC5_APLCA|nr:uncharacterized protein LOC101851387 [Aplysia californica]
MEPQRLFLQKAALNVFIDDEGDSDLLDRESPDDTDTDRATGQPHNDSTKGEVTDAAGRGTPDTRLVDTNVNNNTKRNKSADAGDGTNQRSFRARLPREVATGKSKRVASHGNPDGDSFAAFLSDSDDESFIISQLGSVNMGGNNAVRENTVPYNDKRAQDDDRNANRKSSIRFEHLDSDNRARKTSSWGTPMPSLSFSRRVSSFLDSNVRVKNVVPNTYRMEPLPGQTFSAGTARRMIENVADRILENYQYNRQNVSNITTLIASYVMKKIKRLDCPRYRFVCHVTMIQLTGQGMMVADRVLWSPATDNYAVYKVVAKTFVCVISVHGVYFE